MMSKDWFVTGAGRGMGLDIAKAALAAGHKVVATGRKIDRIAKAVGEPPTYWLSSWTSPTFPTPRLPPKRRLTDLAASMYSSIVLQTFIRLL
jgi:NAD(P)-dependent dehydrogenase (short-subunit alcohol dehydrogenase family)